MNILRHAVASAPLAGCALVAIIMTFPPTTSLATEIAADYPGGNIVARRVEDNTVFLAPDQRDTMTNQWWFYFNFRLRAPADTPVTVVFTDKNPIGVRGPAVSCDGGTTWNWMGAAAVKSFQQDGRPAWSFEARVLTNRTDVSYSFCPQYLESHLKAWLDARGNNPALKVEELCRSRKGRGVELLRVGCLARSKSKGVVLLTSRHHCCEAMATYALEGFLDGALADDELGRLWRDNWEVVAAPFMDKDGVEDGDQGKYRAPHDHNRDYNDQPLYPEVAALMKLGESLKGRIAAVLDMHCPWIRGEWNDRVYLVGPPEQDFWEKEKAFAAVLEQVRQGPIPFRAQDCLPFGAAWNKESNYRQGRSSVAWARDAFPKARLVASMEIPYADARRVEVNANSARSLGRDLARAMALYLSSPGADPR